VPATPPAMLSMQIEANSIGTLWPLMASRANIRLLIGWAKAPTIRARIRPKRATTTPPRNTPAIEAMMPNTFRISAISVRVKPMSR
jgi:hypothetical protein